MRSSHAATLLLALSVSLPLTHVACGGTTRVESDRVDANGIDGSAGEGGPDGAPGDSGTNEDGPNGHTDVTDAGDAGTAKPDGESLSDAPPDFDFTPRRNVAAAYQIDTAHTGSQPDTQLVPPLTKRWSRTFDGVVSYPLIVDGRVFVTAKDAGNRFTKLYALDSGTGAVLWQSARIATGEVPGEVSPAYDRGRVFAASFDGDLVAFEATSGRVLWQIKLPEVYAFATLPVAAGGVVFTSGAADSRDLLIAIDARNGKVLYSVASIGGRPVTLGGSTVFNGSGCYETDALDARTGKLLWHFKTGCFGGGSEAMAYFAGQLYVPDTSKPIVMLDAKTGAERHFQLNGWNAPAFRGDTGFLTQHNELSGVALSDSSVRWRLALGTGVALNGLPYTPPLVVGDFVYVIDYEGTLTAAAATTGKRAWKTPVDEPDRLFSDGGGNPARGLAAGEGKLVVPFQRRLYAYF